MTDMHLRVGERFLICSADVSDSRFTKMIRKTLHQQDFWLRHLTCLGLQNHCMNQVLVICESVQMVCSCTV